VTPTLLPNRKILLQLIVTQDKISSLAINGVPAITTRQLTTQVIVNDQETIVLGGIYEKVEQREEAGIPWLKDIPILGALFKHHNQTQERKELLMFVTPRVISTHDAHPKKQYEKKQKINS
jgi:type IV pilus assembly protein PilQ